MTSSNLEKHRSMYESLVYRSWSAEKAENDLLVSFELELQPNNNDYKAILFFPELKFLDMADNFFALPVNEQKNLAFNLGLAELPSYWKATCPQSIVIDAAHAYSQAQAEALLKWWHSLFIFGMSEFYFVNDIADFGQAGFINWKIKKSDSGQDTQNSSEYSSYQGEDLQSLSEYMNSLIKPDSQRFKYVEEYVQQHLEEIIPKSTLIPVGGGKDSAVTLSFFNSLLRDQNSESVESSNKKISDVKVLLLNPTAAAERIAKQSGFETIRVSRKIDSKLIELNNLGFLNGHTPFSSYLAFVSFAAAHMQAISEIALSNEQSADEGNTWFHGLDINHQYSKTTQFEKSFQRYAQDFLPGNTYYYSILRPLYEIQIGGIFSSIAYKHYNQSFLSCNVGGKKDFWCGECPKCLFAYTLLYPHFLKQTLEQIGPDSDYPLIRQKMSEKSPLFVVDLFAKEAQIAILQDLLGVGPHKPLECVGLYQETLLSAWKSLQLLKELAAELPVLLWFKSEILPRHDQAQLELEWQQMMSHWNEDNTLPGWLKPLFYNWVQEKLQKIT